jgi:CheY-like chemotaxis protein
MCTILFVSHDADLRAVASRVFAKNGWHVALAAHAGHASLACMDRQDFDVIVIEDQMPEAPGATIADRLRRYCRDAQVIRMCDKGTPVRSGEKGIRLVRPFNADHLISAVVDAATAKAVVIRKKSAGVNAG